MAGGRGEHGGGVCVEGMGGVCVCHSRYMTQE